MAGEGRPATVGRKKGPVGEMVAIISSLLPLFRWHGHLVALGEGRRMERARVLKERRVDVENKPGGQKTASKLTRAQQSGSVGCSHEDGIIMIIPAAGDCQSGQMPSLR